MAKKRFDARELMELAVRVMRDTVREHRADNKASPLVGAVLWRPDGSVTTACRGELRDGDHAEFTLLERKHRSERVDDGVLFATLEPCAPGARQEPKRSCAERIVLARIKRVWLFRQSGEVCPELAKWPRTQRSGTAGSCVSCL